MKLSYDMIEENMLRMHTITMQLKKILDDVSLEMNKLNSNDVWKGMGSNYVFENYQKLKNNFTPIYEELERSILYLTDITDGYKYLDKKIQNEIMKNLDIKTPNYEDSRIFVSRVLDKEDNNE